MQAITMQKTIKNTSKARKTTANLQFGWKAYAC